LGSVYLERLWTAGAELLDNTRVLSPIIKNDFIKGVYTKGNKGGETQECYGSVVIDASGMAALLRRQTPVEWGLEKEILNEDTAVLYQEIREVSGAEDYEYLRIYMDMDVAPGGYYWGISKGKNIVKCGIGNPDERGFS